MMGWVWANISELATSKPSNTAFAGADASPEAIFDKIFIFYLLHNLLFPEQMYLKAKQAESTYYGISLF
jgi:hypothetical protein